MNKQRFAFAAVVVGGLGLATAGCILGDDPNKNSQLFGGLAGATGTAGTSGSGGGGGAPSDQLVGSPLATFDSSTESLAFSMFPETPNLATNNNGVMIPTIDFDPADGSPAGGGSLKVFAPYSGANQYVDIQSKQFMPLQNWVGGKLHVRVKVDPGSTFAGQIEPYADTTSNFTFVGTSLNVAMGGGWHDYVVPLDTAMTRNPGYDLKQVIVFGVHIGSGTGGTAQREVTFHIDSFTLEGVTLPGRDAGSDAPADTAASGDTATTPDTATTTDTAASDAAGN